MKIKKILAIVTMLSLMLGVSVGCDLIPGNSENSGSSAAGTESKGEHVVDSEPMDPNGVLDDGGDIIVSDPVESIAGIKTMEGEHDIIIGQDTSYYQLNGTTDQAAWNHVKRIRHSDDQNTIFTLDFTHLEDTSKIGFSAAMIANRKYTCVSISSDGENWTDIGYPDEEIQAIKSDFNVHLDVMLGTEVADSNLYEYYWSLGDYITDSKILYIKTSSCEDKDYYKGLPSATGTDIIGYVRYYDVLEFEISEY